MMPKRTTYYASENIKKKKKKTNKEKGKKKTQKGHSNKYLKTTRNTQNYTLYKLHYVPNT